MKHSKVLSLLFAVFLVFVLGGCEEKDYAGRQVNFSVGASSQRTKVSYGELTGSETPILWKINDEITVYCSQCAEDLYRADYYVDYFDETDGSRAHIVRKTDGLKWGEGTHNFYAVYPGTSTSGVKVATSIVENIITGSMPENQDYGDVAEEEGQTTVSPNMNLLLMAAKNTLESGETSGDAFLDFTPYSTAIELVIVNKFSDTESSLQVNSVALISENHALNGEFSIDMNESGTDGRCLTTTSSTGKKVQLDFSSLSDPIVVPYGGSLVCILFLNPGNSTDVNDLTFELDGVNKGDDSPYFRRGLIQNSSGEGLTFPTYHKSTLRGIMLPETVEWEILFDINVHDWDNLDEQEPELESSSRINLGLDQMTNVDVSW